MNNFYSTKKRLTSLCLLAIGLVSFNANSQCTTPATTLSENFSSFTDGDTFPLSCWGFVTDPSINSTNPLAYISEDTSVTPSNKSAILYAHMYAAGRSFYLISPALSTINGNYHLKFDAKLMSQLGDGSTLEVGSLDSQTNVANFTAVGTPLTVLTPLTTNNQTFTSLTIPAKSGHQYVAIKFTPARNFSSVIIDDIIWEAAPCPVYTTLNETFNGVTALPNCWTKSGNVLVSNNAAVLYSGGAPTTGGVIYLVSPELSTIDGNHLLEYVLTTAAPNNNADLEIGTLSDNTDFTTFSAITTPTPNNGTYTTAAIPAKAGHKYIAFKFTYDNIHQGVRIDNVEWKTALSTPKFDTSKVTVYPNPTSGIFNVESTLNIAQIEVYNSTGQKVLTTANREINLQNAANGLYFVTVTTNEGTQGTYKLIKK